MDKDGVLKIHIEGKSEGENQNQKLTPSNFDISELRQLLTHIENLLTPLNAEKSLISFKLKNGSVLTESHTENTEILERLDKLFYNVNIDSTFKVIDQRQAEAINYFQDMSKKKDRTIKITNSVNPSFELEITPKTNYRAEEELYVDTELTVYGMVTYIGGKTNPSIHIDTSEYGLVTIYTKDYVLKHLKENMIYKEVGILASAKQSMYTYKLKDLNFISFVEYSNEYDNEYLNKLIKIGAETWKDVEDTDSWLRDIRG